MKITDTLAKSKSTCASTTSANRLYLCVKYMLASRCPIHAVMWQWREVPRHQEDERLPVNDNLICASSRRRSTESQRDIEVSLLRQCLMGITDKQTYVCK